MAGIFKLGLTGGIGSGKSTVAQLLAEYGGHGSGCRCGLPQLDSQRRRSHASNCRRFWPPTCWLRMAA